MRRFETAWRRWLCTLLVIAFGSCSERADEASPPTTPPPPVPPSRPIVTPTLVWKRIDLSNPDSVVHDSGTDTYLVSNVDGDRLRRDGKGFISKLSPVARSSRCAGSPAARTA